MRYRAAEKLYDALWWASGWWSRRGDLLLNRWLARRDRMSFMRKWALIESYESARLAR